eukprot:2345246-Rhodomonas_salina.1
MRDQRSGERDRGERRGKVWNRPLPKLNFLRHVLFQITPAQSHASTTTQCTPQSRSTMHTHRTLSSASPLFASALPPSGTQTEPKLQLFLDGRIWGKQIRFAWSKFSAFVKLKFCTRRFGV